ncbi:peptidoglycan D,D-transpeptidase FtsI family protein [Pseudalkalibacillus caeni]|uniref:Penicillin-binding protein 2 n=1 Tax=Exobacillus caeni TaxID=2574798 RepID=A0A5R9FCA2_9BACL|nr:penicillin-binding protein 2 [Pseudalkalibacillus caeni]TLS37285.1 penicillin-binding protein 2 [Pseudalkalibacillus caeni]
MANKKKKKNQVPVRLNILFLFVFILFSLLILRLGTIQIVQGEKYEQKTEQTENVVAKSSAPRGKMYDRQGRVVVDNKPTYTLTYIRSQNTDPSERLETAKVLADYIEKETDKLTERDLKDYWILTREEEAKAKLSEEEWEKLEDKKAYRLQLDRITEQDLNQITEPELEVAAIKREMDTGYALTSQVIKEGLTAKEMAVISEHLASLPGVDIKMSAEREYPFGDTLNPIFGNLGPIQRASKDFYVSRGYDLNDLVGKSFLEQQYEELLRGQKTKTKFITDKSGEPIGNPETIQGKRGNDLVLTVDMELQQGVEKIIEKNIREEAYRYQVHSAYAIMMNPKTGEVLAMAGKEKDGKGGFIDKPYGTVYNAYEMGSAVKGASVLTGYNLGVISPGSVLVDTPLYIGETRKKSYTSNGMGPINDLTALERSSNVYMFRIAMRAAGFDYVPHKKGGTWNPDAYGEVRRNFAQFGLGVKTGIDVPNESVGYNGGIQQIGNLMDMMIGQFDTYTPLQMVQYISTIANGGKRMEPHLVKSVREPTNGDGLSNSIVYQNEPRVLNHVEMKQSWIERVQQGLYQVVHGSRGTARRYFEGADYVAAGKTGTAQSNDNYNLTLVGYAPYDDPEVAFAVAVPDVNGEAAINKHIGREILDLYFELKKSGSKMNLNDEKMDEEKAS